MILNKIGFQKLKKLFTVFFYLSLFSSIASTFFIFISINLMASADSPIYKIFIANTILLIWLKCLYYRNQKTTTLYLLCCCCIVSFSYWIVNSFSRMKVYFTEGLIDFILLGIPSIVIIWFFIEFAIVSKNR